MTKEHEQSLALELADELERAAKFPAYPKANYAGAATPPAVEARVPTKTPAMHEAVRKVLKHHKLTEQGDGVVESDLIYAVLGALSAAPAAPGPQAVAASDWDIRGMLAAELKCWHRLTAHEVEDLILFVKKISDKPENTVAQPEIDDDEAAAWMYPCDIEKFKSGEHVAEAFSIKVRSPTHGVSAPLFTKDYLIAYGDARAAATQPPTQQASTQGEQAQQASAQPTQAAKDVLDCPFCGKEPIGHAIEAHEHSPLLKALAPDLPDHQGSYVIECVCGAGFVDETQEGCTALWNRRASNTGQES